MSSSIAAKAVVSKPNLKVHLADVRSGNFSRIAIDSPKLAADSKFVHEVAKKKNLDKFVDDFFDIFGKSSNTFIGLGTKRLGSELSKGTFDDPKVREILLDLMQKNPDAIDSLPKVLGNLVRSGFPTSSLAGVASRAIGRSNTLCPVDVSQTLAADLQKGEYSDYVSDGDRVRIHQALSDLLSPNLSPQNTPSDPVVSPSAPTPFSSPVSEGIIRIPLSISAPANSNSDTSPVLLASSPVVSLGTSLASICEPLATIRDMPVSSSSLRPAPQVELVQTGSRKSDSILVLPRPIVQSNAVVLDPPPSPSIRSSAKVSSSSARVSPSVHCTNYSPAKSPISLASSLASPNLHRVAPIKSGKKKVGADSTNSPQIVSLKKPPKSKPRPSSKVSLPTASAAKSSSKKPAKLNSSNKKSKISLDKKPLKKTDATNLISAKSKNKKLTENFRPSKLSQKKSIQNTRPLKISPTSVSKSKKSPKPKFLPDTKKIKTPKSAKKIHFEKSSILTSRSPLSTKSKKPQKLTSNKKMKTKIDSEMDRQKLLRRKKAKRIVLALLLSKKKKKKSTKFRL